MQARSYRQSSKRKRRPDIRLVSRIATVLRALSEEPEGMSLGGIAKVVSIPRPTVQRLVDALQAEGYVARGDKGASIRLGPEVARLGIALSRDMSNFFRPLMANLQKRSGETVDLTLLHPKGAVVIEQFASPHSLRVVSHPGKALPLHATASGKAHLAQTRHDERERLLTGPLQAFTRSTMVDPVQLEVVIDSAIPQTVFIDQEEYYDDVCAVGIGLIAAGFGNIAMAISMPTSRFADSKSTCEKLLVNLWHQLARR